MAQFVPSGKDGMIPRPRNLDQDIRVDHNGLQDAILLSLPPFRSWRT